MLATYIKLLLTALFWGGTFISGRLLAAHVSPLSAAFLRFAVASVLLLCILGRRGALPPLPRRLWLPIALLGLTGVFAYNILFFWGLRHVPAGRAALIVANNPVMIALGAALIYGHRLGWVKSAGVLVSVTGAALAISRGDFASLLAGGLGLYDLLIFGCVLSWVSFSLIGKKVLAEIAPLTAIAYSAAAGTLLLAGPALAAGLLSDLPGLTWMDWSNVAYLGVFGTVLGFVWYYEGIERIGPTRAALFINFVPVSAIVLAYLILGEPVTWSLGAGAALVVCGVYLTNNGLASPWRRRRGVVC